MKKNAFHLTLTALTLGVALCGANPALAEVAGGTKDTIKATPEFTYTKDTALRDRFVAAAESDIARGKAKVAELEKKAGAAATDAKAKIDLQVAELKRDVKSAQSKLTELKRAGAVRWKNFEAGVNAAAARMRKSIDAATG